MGLYDVMLRFSPCNDSTAVALEDVRVLRSRNNVANRIIIFFVCTSENDVLLVMSIFKTLG